MNICSASLDPPTPSLIDGNTGWCVGVSFVPNGAPDGLGGVGPRSCWLKYAVPGHGAEDCGVVQSYVVDSAILQVQGRGDRPPPGPAPEPEGPGGNDGD